MDTREIMACAHDYCALTVVHHGRRAAQMTLPQFTSYLCTLTRHGGALLITQDANGAPMGTLTVHTADRGYLESTAFFRDLVVAPGADTACVTAELLAAGRERARAMGCTDALYLDSNPRSVCQSLALHCAGFRPHAAEILGCGL
jgi:hypothetical protein